MLDLVFVLEIIENVKLDIIQNCKRGKNLKKIKNFKIIALENSITFSVINENKYF